MQSAICNLQCNRQSATFSANLQPAVCNLQCVMMAPVKLPYEEFDLSGVHTYPLASRKSKANAADFATPFAGGGIGAFVESLPSILAAADFKAVVAAMKAAQQGGRAIIWGLGAHVIKTGLSPVLIDLMEHGFVSAVATNGAGIIH